MWTVDDINNRTKVITDKIIEIFPYVKSDYVIKGRDPKREIYLDAKGVYAIGYLNEDNSVTVYADSQVRYDLSSYDYVMDLRADLLENEIIIEKNGMYVFSQNYTFDTPSSSADFIIGGTYNGWQYWKDRSGVSIGNRFRY